MIRLADLEARHRAVAEDVEARVRAVLRSGRYVGGPVVEEAERRLAAAFGWQGGVGVNSGTDALGIALQLVGVRPGDEVLVPAVSFFATAGAVARLGAVPVIVDVRSDAPLLDPERLPLRARTRAVIAVHLFGARCSLPELPVPIVDDAAQAIGAAPPARTGTIGAASFYPTKTLGAAGDAGILLSDDPSVLGRARRLTHHGLVGEHLHENVDGCVGGNSRLDALQAAVLLGHLPALAARIARRQVLAARYDADLPGWLRPLPREPGHPVHQYVVRAPGRDILREKLRTHGIETGAYYPVPLSRQPALARFAPGPTPQAERWCAEALALPVHEALTDEEQSRVIEMLHRLGAP